MNREQFQAKRTWLRGTSVEAEHTSAARVGDLPVCDAVSQNPTALPLVSLADYYLRFHPQVRHEPHCDKSMREL